MMQDMTQARRKERQKSTQKVGGKKKARTASETCRTTKMPTLLEAIHQEKKGPAKLDETNSSEHGSATASEVHTRHKSWMAQSTAVAGTASPSE